MKLHPASVIHPLHDADERCSIRHVFLRDLTVPCCIGVHDHEKKGAQRVRFNLDLAVREDGKPLNDDHANVVCYEEIADGIRKIAAAGHVNLVETLAEAVADMCLKNPRVRMARVRVEKIDVFCDAASAGVEIERFNRTG